MSLETTTTTAQPLLSVEAVSKHFNDGALSVKVLSEISFQVQPKQRLAIVGASGSGKSTLLQHLHACTNEWLFLSTGQGARRRYPTACCAY